MANGRKENVWLATGIELFITHWKYGHDYESSTVLTDWAWNIIAFFDRGTDNIDRIEIDIPFRWWFIIANWEGIDRQGLPLIKYEPYDFEMARNKWKEQVMELKMWANWATLLWKEMKDTLNEYNKNYFINILEEIWN